MILCALQISAKDKNKCFRIAPMGIPNNKPIPPSSLVAMMSTIKLVNVDMPKLFPMK